MTLSGTNVVDWDDRSDYGHALSMSTNKTTQTVWRNFNEVVSFDGNNRWFKIANTGALNPNGNRESDVFVVGRSNVNTYGAFFTKNNGTSWNGLTLSRANNGKF